MTAPRTRRLEYRTLDGFKIVGDLLLPARPVCFAILMHGIASNRNEYQQFFRDMATRLAEQRVATLRFDFRGHGESSGSSKDISIIGEVLDTKASLNEVGKRWNRQVALVAMSFAAGPAIICAAELGEEVRSLVLLSPVLDYEATFLRPVEPHMRAVLGSHSLKAFEKTGYVTYDGLKLSARLVEELRVVRPYNFALDPQTRILVIHGNRDDIVPFKVSARYAANSNHSVEFVTIKRGGHGFRDCNDSTGTSRRSVTNRETILEKVEQFLLGTE
jgi:hypothetical protein